MPKHADGRLYPKHWPHRRWREQCALSLIRSKQRARIAVGFNAGFLLCGRRENNRFCTSLTQAAHRRCAATSFELGVKRGSDSHHRLRDLQHPFVLVHGAFAQRLPGRLLTEAVLLHQPVLGLIDDPAFIK